MRKPVWPLAIILAAACCGTLADWRAPGISRYARDWLMRVRGPLRAPDDIALVAIDEASIQRFGRFPWSRQVMAATVSAVAAAQPKAIALDVLFTDPTSQEDDDALARAIGHAGNVVVAAELTESPVHGGPSVWLMPLPQIGRAAAAIGHVNVQTEADGVPRQIEVRAADDAGQTLRALAVEAVRIGDGTPEQGVQNTQRALLLGPRTIPLDASGPRVVIAQDQGGAQELRGGRMSIDFIGPTGSFGAQTYSLAQVLDGRVPAARLHGKYVLIGSTAASMSDRLASPFVHQTDARADQHGSLMPGVEVLANALNTILQSRFYSETSGWASFLIAALIAALTLGLLELAQGGNETVKQLAVLAGLAALVLLAGYLQFRLLLVYPPIVPGMVSFASAGTLVLLHRSLAASARLDRDIQELAASEELLPPGHTPAVPPPSRVWLPRGLEWKAQALGELNAQLLSRARFVDQALRSVEDGLLIAAPDGRITFVNRSAASILGATPAALAGQDLAQRLFEKPDPDLLARLVTEHGKVEREIAIRGVRTRHYVARLAAVCADDSPTAPVLGIVASLSDITRQHELQQTKNDVVALVSHEMRTPLTAIQGMTELLAAYELGVERRREMHLAINDEVKRLARMITEYLDITRLESGATVLRRSPVRVASILERLLLLLDPVAGRRGIRLTRQFAPELPALLADPDLLSRAAENLVSNAIKYSPADTEVTISAMAGEGAVWIEVTDRGYGIPEADLSRIFEKFYRVPRVQDADVPGTGLGLSLVREIAELHGGSVSVKSEVNAGSTFTLKLPLPGEAG